MKHLYLFGLLLSLPFFGFSQSDHEFWFVAPPVTHQFVSPSPILYQNLNRPIRLYFTTADGPATITVDQPANPSFTPITTPVNNNLAGMVDLTSFIDLVETKPSNPRWGICDWGPYRFKVQEQQVYLDRYQAL